MAAGEENSDDQKIAKWVDRRQTAFGYFLLFFYLLGRTQFGDIPAAIHALGESTPIKLVLAAGLMLSFMAFFVLSSGVMVMTKSPWPYQLFSFKFRHFVPALIGIAFFEVIILGSRMLER